MGLSARFFSLYASLSVAVGSVMCWATWKEHGQFFTTITALSTGKLPLLLLANMVVSLTICVGTWMKDFFLDTLRDAEQSDLLDNVKYAVLEMLLALTLFREDLSLRFGGLLLLLVFSKSFHWLATSRASFMESFADPPQKQTRRMLLLFLVLFLSDVVLLNAFFANIVHRGFSVILLFACEYLVSFCTICASLGRFFVWRYDLSRTRQMQVEMHKIRVEKQSAALQSREEEQGDSDGSGEEEAGEEEKEGEDSSDDEFGVHEDIDDIEVPRWGSKDTIMFFLNFTRDLMTSLTYLLCFGILSFMHGGIPIHMMRELYISFASLLARLSDLKRYMLVKSRLISRTREEVEEGATCNICHEALVDSIMEIPGCHHVYHFHCLVRWLGENPRCPLCNQDVFELIDRHQDALPAGPQPQDDVAAGLHPAGDDAQQRNGNREPFYRPPNGASSGVSRSPEPSSGSSKLSGRSPGGGSFSSPPPPMPDFLLPRAVASTTTTTTTTSSSSSSTAAVTTSSSTTEVKPSNVREESSRGGNSPFSITVDDSWRQQERPPSEGRSFLLNPLPAGEEGRDVNLRQLGELLTEVEQDLAIVNRKFITLRQRFHRLEQEIGGRS